MQAGISDIQEFQPTLIKCVKTEATENRSQKGYFRYMYLQTKSAALLMVIIIQAGKRQHRSHSLERHQYEAQ